MKIIDLQEIWNQMNEEDLKRDEKVPTHQIYKTGSGWDDDWDDDCCCCLGGYSK